MPEEWQQRETVRLQRWSSLRPSRTNTRSKREEEERRTREIRTDRSE